MFIHVTYSLDVTTLLTSAASNATEEGPELTAKNEAISDLLLVRNVLRLRLGEEPKRRFRQKYPDPNNPVQRNTYQELIVCMEECLMATDNKEIQRAHLHKMRQGPNQRYDDFLLQIKAQATKCKFQADSEREMVKSAFILGMREKTTLEQRFKKDLIMLPCDDDDTFKSFTEKVDSFELGLTEKNRLTEIQNSSPSSVLQLMPEVAIKEEPIFNIDNQPPEDASTYDSYPDYQ